MFDDPDLTPQKQPKKPKDLAPLSVADLDAYITALQDEITRAEGERNKKKSYKDNVDALFKKQ